MNALLTSTIIALAIIITSIISVSALEDKTIPIWIKNIAEWWSEDMISDSEFVNVLQFLIDENILHATDRMPLYTDIFIPSVVIDTDKKQYKIGEEIHITIYNNGNTPISAIGGYTIKISDIDENFISLFDTSSSHFSLYPNQTKTFSWDQTQMPGLDFNSTKTPIQVDPGRYKIEMSYLPRTIESYPENYNTVIYAVEIIK